MFKISIQNEYGIIYSFWKIIRLLIITSIAIIGLNIIPFILFGKLVSSFTNYSIVLGVVCGTLICVRTIEKKKLTDIGLAFRKIDIIYFITGIFIAIILNAIIISIASVQLGTNLLPQLFINFSQSGRNIFAFMVIPLTEELIYRGYILNNTFPKLKFMHRSILSSLLFSMPHWNNADNLSFVLFVFTFVFCTFIFGLFFNSLVSITGSIWCGFGFHWIYNFLGATLFMNTSNYNLAVITTSAFLVIGLFVLRKVKHMSKKKCDTFYANFLIWWRSITIILYNPSIFHQKGAWLQHRAQTLSLWMMLVMSVPQFFTGVKFAIVSTHNPTAYMFVSVIALAANVGVAIYQVYTIVKIKRNPLKDELYTELNSYKEIKKATGFQISSFSFTSFHNYNRKYNIFQTCQ